MVNPERMAQLILELRQMNLQLTRAAIDLDTVKDPTGILRAAYLEASKRCQSAAVALAGAGSMTTQQAPEKAG